jgi:hypothetical protein
MGILVACLEGVVMQRVLHGVFSEPRYYLCGVAFVIVVMVVAFVFFIQTGTTSGH